MSNEASDRTAKEALCMPGLTTTKLPYTDYYPVIRKDWEKKHPKMLNINGNEK